jgi:ubiquinone/menaquinone biosynthesis C-methylase UbiE
MDSPKNTSWHKVGKWYHQAVGESGHFYHQSVIFPRLHSLFPLSSHDKILDLGCGNGIFTSQLPKGTQYVGVDSASSLLKEAQNTHVSPRFKFVLSDVTQKLPLSDTNFTPAKLKQGVKSPRNT